jgi:hypothetical protein
MGAVLNRFPHCRTFMTFSTLQFQSEERPFQFYDVASWLTLDKITTAGLLPFWKGKQIYFSR